MSEQELPLNIFLASPGDLEEEREQIRALVKNYNRRRNTSAKYNLLEWSQVRGQVGRPQEKINQLVHESHYMIVLFKSRWGSNPGSPWKFTSGTEEEMFTGLLDLGNGDRPMRDVWVGFIDSVDPDAQVKELRHHLNITSQIMYDRLPDAAAIEKKLGQILEEWARINQKTPKRVKLIPGSGKDVLGPAWKMQAGQTLIQAGESSLGLRRLKKAAKYGGAEEKLAYAEELTRTNHFKKALSLTQTAIKIYAAADKLYTAAAADAFRRKANLMRLQGESRKAELVALKAIERAERSGDEAKEMLAALQDELGLCYQDMKQFEEAEARFKESLRIRIETSSPEVSRSRIKICRMRVFQKDLEGAQKHIDEALSELKDQPGSALKADAYLARAQLSLRQGALSDALENATRSIECNRYLGNERGETMSLYVKAQVLNALRDPAARSIAKQVYKRNKKASNKKGMDLALYQLEGAERIRREESS